MISHHVARGRPVAGVRIGILCLDTRHQLAVGNVQHAASFDFPVTYGVVRGVSFPDIMRGLPSALAPILAAVRELEEFGVDIIVGACGSFGHYQRDVVAEARVPVCLSILCQVPFIISLLPNKGKLGIIFANDEAFTDRVKDQCGITDVSRIVTLSANTIPAFSPILDPILQLNEEELSEELTALVLLQQALDPSIVAWAIQCSDLPPYSTTIAQATGLPVFDMTILISHLQKAIAGLNMPCSLRKSALIADQTLGRV